MIPIHIQSYAIILILLFSMVFFIWRKWSYAITAISALFTAVILGLVPIGKTFSGLGNPAVITVASILIITSVITKSNVLNILISKLDFFSHSQTAHVFSFSFIIAFLSAFMNNIGALGLMLPMSLYTSLKQNRSPSYILMPIAMASALGGMVTLIGTPPNLLISDYRKQAIGQSFSMFDFSYVGLLTAFVGVIFIGLLGWRLLPKQRKQKDLPKPIYTFEIRIPPQSTWIGKPFKFFKDENKNSIEILGMIRKGRKKKLSTNTEIKSGDRFIIESTLINLEELSYSKDVIIANYIKRGTKNKESNEVLVEAIVPKNSKIQGKKFKDTNLRAQHKISVIAISQSIKSNFNRVRDIVIEPGDMLFLQCKNPNELEKFSSIGLIKIEESTLKLNEGFKVFVPLIIFAIAILLVGVLSVPVQLSFAVAAFLMILFDKTALKYVQERFDWSIIILLASMIPIGDALAQTGGADLIAHILLGFSQHQSIFLTIGLLLVITMFVSDFINNAATAIVMAPIAISLSNSMGISVDPFLMAVAIGASCAFLTPIGHQNNLLVMGPGRYKFFDYMRIGLPLEIIIIIVATPLIYWIWYL